MMHVYLYIYKKKKVVVYDIPIREKKEKDYVIVLWNKSLLITLLFVTYI